jgi:hypothetical protein
VAWGRITLTEVLHSFPQSFQVKRVIIGPSHYFSEPLTPEPSPFEVEIAIAKLKRYKSPGSDQIPAELIQAGGEILQSEIHKLINLLYKRIA